MSTEDVLASTLNVPAKLKQIQINPHTINYLVAGEGPPLLLLHGANFGWGIWHTNIDELAAHFTVYALDLPGAGRSSTIDYSTLDLEKDLVYVVSQFIQVLELKDVNIVGCSIGGWLALKMALHHPEIVNKMAIENSVGFADYFNISEKVFSVYPLAKLITTTILKPERGNKKVESFLRGIFYNKNLAIQKEFLDYFYETMERSHNLLFLSRLAQLHKEFPLGDDLKRIKQKILIIWGEKDKIVPLKKNQHSFALLPNSNTEIMSDASHIPSFESPNRFNKFVLDYFLV